MVLLGLLTAAVPAGDPPRAQESEDRVDAAMDEIAVVLEAIRRNLEEQSAAWPHRERDQLRELPPPPAVRKLQAEHCALRHTRERLQDRLRVEASKALRPLLETISWTDDAALLEVIVPVAVQVGGEDPRTLQTLLGVARERDFCPPVVLEGLTLLGGPEAARLLGELGVKRRSLRLLRASGRIGEIGGVSRLIDLAESEDPEAACLGLEALGSLTPPERYSARTLEEIVRSAENDLGTLEETKKLLINQRASGLYRKKLEEMVVSRIKTARSPRVQCALLVYLGLFENEDNLVFLERTYLESKNLHVRLAALSALGNIGPPAGSFLRDELMARKQSLSIRKRCLHALGVMRCRDAVPDLIELLTVPVLKRDASVALARIAGEDLGDQEAFWLRWWQRQPESEDEEVAFIE
jgi:hypothetical protein